MNLSDVRLIAEFMRSAHNANQITINKFIEDEDNFAQGLAKGMKIANDGFTDYLNRLENLVRLEDQKEEQPHELRSL